MTTFNLKGINMELKDAAALFLKAKTTENNAKEKRLQAEKDLLRVFGKIPLDGTTTKATDGYKISVTGKLTRNLDFPAYKACDLPENIQFVEMVPRINMKRLKAVEMVDPVLVASLVTVKPAKTAIKVEEVK